MLLSAASFAAPSARRGRQQARPQRRTGGLKVSAAIQERRGSSPPRNREPEKDDEGFALFGKRVILRVEPEEPEPDRFYDDGYDEPRRNGARRPAPRVAPRKEEKEGSPLDGLLSAFAQKDERDEDPYDRFVREERRERFEREGRRSVSNRSPSPRREYDDFDYDDRPRSRSSTGSNGAASGLLSGLSALTKSAADIAGELNFGRESDEPRSAPRRLENGSRGDAPRRRLVRRDDDDYYFQGDERDEGKKGLGPVGRRAAIAACLCGGCAVAAVRYARRTRSTSFALAL